MDDRRICQTSAATPAEPGDLSWRLGERAFKAVGRPLPRNEDGRLITGRGRFSDDFSLPGQVWAAVVRSPYPHARIAVIDLSAAMAAPGVLAVYTGADCRNDGLRPIPHNPVPSTRFDLKLTGRNREAVFVGPHHGEGFGMVVAESLEQAQTGAEQVAVDSEVLPWVADTSQAAQPGAPKLWDELPDNILVDSTFGDVAATDAAFAAACHIVSMKTHIGRVTGVPLEPRAALGNFDAETGRYIQPPNRLSPRFRRPKARMSLLVAGGYRTAAISSNRPPSSMSKQTCGSGRKRSWPCAGCHPLLARGGGGHSRQRNGLQPRRRGLDPRS
jgi:Aldehyde oxidase and xanthine dehydrogenase, a/b hammerhead domain/Molybdopterin cofactor-binding domain